MEKIKMIYNPSAGRRILQKNIPKLVEILRKDCKKVVDISATMKRFDAKQIAFESCLKGYDVIVAVGGDGTVNEVVNGMMESGCPSNLAIYPAGTINDFSSYLNIPRDIESFKRMLLNNQTMKVDVGMAGDKYFINVAASGLLTDVPYRVSSETKTVLGKFAYYIEGIKEFPKQIFKPIKIQLEIDGKLEEKEILFFILANSPSVGGFKYIAPQAKINDGLLDLLLVEKSQFIDIAAIFFKTLKGNHIDHPNLKYIQLREFTIHCCEEISVDLDGEIGGGFPVTFRVKKEALNFVVP